MRITSSLPHLSAAKLALLLCFLGLLSACGEGSITTTPAPEATTAIAFNTPASAPFQPFSDWRVAYVGPSGNARAVSQDGKVDTVGPFLPGLIVGIKLNLNPPAISPDGHLLAYEGQEGVTIVDLAGRRQMRKLVGRSPNALLWSPDSKNLALSEGRETDIIQMSDGSDQKIPHLAGSGTAFTAFGWIDTTHLLVYFTPPPPTPAPGAPTPTPVAAGGPPPTTQTLTLAAVDIISGKTQMVTSITSASMGQAFVSVARDGRHALYYNKRLGNWPYVQDVRLIDTMTGATTRLPRLAGAMDDYSGFTSIGWLPGSLTLAASTGFDKNGDLKTWILDAQHDTTRQSPYHGFVAGWLSDNGPLILTSGWETYTGAGPYTITAISGALTGSGSSVTLTNQATTFPWLGFVRAT